MKMKVNMAVAMVSMFMAAIWRRADLDSRGKSLNAPRYHYRSKLPKGFSKHNPAGTKMARLASSGAISMRGRVALD